MLSVDLLSSETEAPEADLPVLVFQPIMMHDSGLWAQILLKDIMPLFCSSLHKEAHTGPVVVLSCCLSTAGFVTFICTKTGEIDSQWFLTNWTDWYSWSLTLIVLSSDNQVFPEMDLT